jgi:serine protease AprX
MIQIPTPLVEFILLGPQDDRRQLQDSPILGDVWVEYGKNPAERIDLLIAPYRGEHPGDVAAAIDDGLPDAKEDKASIAFLQGVVVASLTFEELIRIVAPKTSWWIVRKKNGTLAKYNPVERKSTIQLILDAAEQWNQKTGHGTPQELLAIQRFLTLLALIVWAASHDPGPIQDTKTTEEQIALVLERAKADLDGMVKLLDDLVQKMWSDKTVEPMVWQVSRNRSAMPSISRSVPAVKADAATTLFKVNCSEIGWAVLDSGIDGAHPAFFDAEGKTRVKRSFDFKNFRRIVSLSNHRDNIRKTNLTEIMKKRDDLKHPWDPADDDKEAHEVLKRLAEGARSRGPVNWELVQKFVEIKPSVLPQTNHGTHVAGIIGASKQSAQNKVNQVAAEKAAKVAAEKAAKKAAEGENNGKEDVVENTKEIPKPKENPDFGDGMCPDISLYDFRVLGPGLKDTEFAIIAALQFIRYLNERNNFYVIHGANLSLSIPHDVRNFACGRTPICDECERLIASGVVVVAAAGNHGYKSFETKEGSYDSYAAFSITDPGNADNVLTVGATHRYWPHTYGVSFFSSRGPTGDGRIKPDLVAPGERIKAPFPGSYDLGGDWGDLDGTSMAAPHVSGAAAMLMARYSELIGQPLRIKRILCESATDLGRERSFQGHGMLDVLRAFQSI